jgi:tetratricopeptide (TPR) repeat protein
MGCRGRRWLMALLVLVLVAGSHASWAQHTVNKMTYEALMASQEALEAGRTSEARAVLDTLREKEERLNDHEKALLYQSYGYLEAGEGRYAEALEHLEKCLAQKGLPDAAQLQTLYNLAQLYTATEHYPKAVKALTQWLRASKQRPPAALYMLAAAYYQQDMRDKALTPAILAVRESDEPKEAWLQLLLSLRIEREEYAKARPVLEQLTNLYPKKVYWMQLAAVYGELGQENESLAALELAYQQGLLDRDEELRRLAQLYLYHDLPYLGARVMEKGLADGTIAQDSEAYEILANGWMRAREFDRAIEPLTEAASAASDGELYLRLGQAFAEKEDWGAAADALRRAIEKGGLEEPGAANLLLGVALFNQEQLESARPYFARAAQRDKTRKDAELWLKLVDKARGADADAAGITDSAAIGS